MFGINGSELIVLVVLALVILGPEKLPEYTRSLTQWIRRLREMAEGAKTQFKEETGTDFDEVDWRKYDPRQYDPRRIIREALSEPVGGSSTPAARAQELTGVAPEDLHGGLTRDDLREMDPRTLFRRPSGDGSTAVAAEDLPAPAEEASAASASAAPAAAAGVAATGAAAALLASGRAAEVLTDPVPAAVAVAERDIRPDPLELLGLAPAPFDVDAT